MCRPSAHVAPLGLGRKDLSSGYRHVAPLELNEPTNRFLCRSESLPIIGILREMLGHGIGVAGTDLLGFSHITYSIQKIRDSDNNIAREP
ncbi:hypothetical protein J4G02_22540 [Candidatus Poribacteria bacterium]|nr:hypothetical protein [Candidatus Poribacteria bacterium]